MLNSEKGVVDHVLRNDHLSLNKLIKFLTNEEIFCFDNLHKDKKTDLFKKILIEILKVADGKFPAKRTFTKIELEVHGFKIMVHGTYVNDKLRISTLYLVD